MMRPLLVAILLALSACASMPSAEEVGRANIGPVPDQRACELVILGCLDRTLKDPQSAIVRFGTLQKGCYRATQFSAPKFAWRLRASVNAKNSFGGYVGAQPYDYYFLGDRLVAQGQWIDSSSGGAYIVGESPGGLTAEDAGLGSGHGSGSVEKW